jgi:uncharacterized membrane protein
MMTNQELKNSALAALKDNWAPAVVGAIFFTFATCLIISLGYCANMAAFDMPFFNSINPKLLKIFSNSSFLLNFFLLYPLSLGYSVAHKELLQNGDAAITRNTVRLAFSDYVRNAVSILLVYLYTLLWTLLFIVPGIIKGLAYSLTPFIVKDNPQLSPNQAINLSMKMMKGHKFDLFYLYLSFIGWIFLAILTLGIGLLWVIPYMQTSMAAFYLDVKNDYNNNI